MFENFTNERGGKILQEGEIESSLCGFLEILQRVGKVAYELELPS